MYKTILKIILLNLKIRIINDILFKKLDILNNNK